MLVGGGGGLYIAGDSTTVVTLRQSSFINNDATGNGDEIHTFHSPTISLINTYFNNTYNDNNVYAELFQGITATWKTCNDTLCTETPYTSTCTPIDSTNAKFGVDCACPNCITCSIGNVLSFYNQGGQRNEATCMPCGKGKFNNNLNGQFLCNDCSAGTFNDLESQGICKNCSIGKFSYFKGEAIGCEEITDEWKCAARINTGSFTRSTDCTISGNNHVFVSNTLEIAGTTTDINHLITITAATKKRHFYLNNANAKLILRYLKLVGGDVSSYSGWHGTDTSGGSILIDTNGGELNLYSSIVFNNKAKFNGGGIRASGDNTNKNAIMNIYNSIIHNNEASYGGGICMYFAVATIYNTTIDNNLVYIVSAVGGAGGGMHIHSSEVTMRNTIISNNKAFNGGGLNIYSDSSVVILRQSSFINNDATGNGDEIYTSESPTISLINTYFNNPNNNNNIVGAPTWHYQWGTPTWTNCNTIPLCTFICLVT